MQKEAAKKLIRDTLEKPFDKDQFTVFIKNLLNHLEYAPFPRPRTGQMIFADFRNDISSLDRVGKYIDSDGHKLDVLIVKLSKTTSLERARSKLRNFVAKYLKESQGGQYKDAALVAFVSPNEEDWRFSFVKMEYKFDTTKKGQPRVKEEFTPAKRYSFLVGENENSHTAQSRLLPILENTDNDPSLSDIEEAFSVEKVTKEFFEKYRGLFLEIKEALDQIVQKDKAIKTDFEEKGVDTVDFIKKLLGQIVFLYFLQKKGWFGVGKRSEWGTGPKRFLRELFDKKHGGYQNFFNDILEPLFYNTLAVERPGDYSDKFDCRIPFLNGGLFDPLNDYDWQRTDILLSDKLFSNDEKTKQGDVGTGILDVFDRYNFTVKEDEPLEKEVAIDPEMLGKVFENLLEVKDRKSKGTYYTPREIVHYMCQESLINYLVAELKDRVRRKDIETLIKHGDAIIDHEQQVLRAGKETTRYPYRLSPVIRDSASVIDKKLADIKVCDPAVGSGAFLIGMMSEIVRTRSVLARINNPDEEPNIYDFKRDAIQDSLHGVDIDLGAVEIAKLRLWLSLIVDEEDYKHIKPLPNLDYKIMQGNSLLEEYEGIKLIDERFFEKKEEKGLVQKRLKEQQSKWQREYFDLHSNSKLTPTKKSEIEKNLKSIEKQLEALEQPKPNGQDAFDIFGQTEAQSKAERLLELHEQFFNAHHKSDKDHLHKEIDKLTWDLVATTLEQEGKEDKLEDVKRFQRTNTSPFFLWKLNFAEIFRDNRGFDVIIANPPYIVLPAKSLVTFSWTKGNKNTYVAFLEIASHLISGSGVVCYIIPTTWLAGNNFLELRKSLLESESIQQIVQLPYDIFEVYVDNLILILTGAETRNRKVKTFKFNIRSRVNSEFLSEQFDINIWSNDPQKVIFLNKQLIGVLNRYRSLPSDKLGDISKVQRGTLPPKPKEQVLLASTTKKKNVIDWFTGQVYRYQVTDGQPFKVDYDKLRENKPLEIFQKTKLMGRQLISRQFRMQFAYFNMPCAFKKNLYAIYDLQGEYEWRYLLAILNSRLFSFIQVNLNTSGQRDDYPAFSLKDFRNFLIPKQSKPRQKEFVNLVLKAEKLKTNSILNSKTSEPFDEFTEIDRQIDNKIYALYGLTKQEIAIVEGDSKDK